jgi:RNA polymerase sigma factor (sigma-70 family)
MPEAGERPISVRTTAERRVTTLRELESLYERRFDAFAHCAYAVTADRELARDAVQEAFAYAIRRRRTVRDPEALEAWMWRVVSSRAVDLARRRVRDERVESQQRATDVRVEADPRAELSEIARALRALPERQRLILFLRYYADLDYTAIGRAVGVSPGTVGAALNAAHSSLKGRLMAYES